MNPIDTSKYTVESLKLILNESNKLQENVLKSITEYTNKSFIIVAVYSSLLSYSFLQMVDKDKLYFVVVIGSILGVLKVKDNLFPFTTNLNGALPENMIDDYFNQFKGEELDKEYLATQIQSYNSALIDNKNKIERMSEDFIYSAIILVLTLIIFGALVCFFAFGESPNT